MKGEAEAQCLFSFRQSFDEKMMNAYYAAGQRVMPNIHRIIVFIGHHRFHRNTWHPHSEKTGSRSLPAKTARTATTDAAQGIIGFFLTAHERVGHRRGHQGMALIVGIKKYA